MLATFISFKTGISFRLQCEKNRNIFQNDIEMSSNPQIVKKKSSPLCKHLVPSNFFNIIRETLFVLFVVT